MEKNINELEEGNRLQIDFSKIKTIGRISTDVVPVVVQDAETREVIVIAYVNCVIFSIF